jgi:hypothetical protein
MDEETKEKLQEMNKKLGAIYKSAEKTRKYFKWTMIISIVVVVLPLIGLFVAIPLFLNLYSGVGDIGGGGGINQTLNSLGL